MVIDIIQILAAIDAHDHKGEHLSHTIINLEKGWIELLYV